MQREVFLVKAFTKDKNQGNPAGIVVNADDLSLDQMVAISADLGFSESAFVQKSAAANFRVRFISPKEEVNFCGHATVATFHTLTEQGILRFDGVTEVEVNQETKAGILPVFCRNDGYIVMVQNKPEFGKIEDNRALIARLLSISETEILNYPIQPVSTAASKLMIPISSLTILQSIKPDLKGILEYSKRTGTRGFYPFTPQTLEGTSDFHARQFNPLIGIDEDPITGVAAGALGSYVVEYGLSNKKSFVIEQGFGMGKGGKMYVDVSNGVKVGGYAVTFGKKEFKFS